MLDVASVEFGSVKAKRFATNERDGFRRNFAQVAGRVFTVHERFGRCMSRTTCAISWKVFCGEERPTD
jgi:hypothetical protein